jgi:hypothetical protein
MRRRDFITLLGGAATRPLSFTLLSLAIAVSGPEPTKAHDIYSALKDRGGVSCCSEHDCRPAHYRFTPAGTAWGHWCGLTSFVTLTYCAILPPSSAYSSPRADEVIE